MRGEAPVCSSKYTTVVSKTCVKDKTEGLLKSRNAKKFSRISFFFNDEVKQFKKIQFFDSYRVSQRIQCVSRNKFRYMRSQSNVHTVRLVVDA